MLILPPMDEEGGAGSSDMDLDSFSEALDIVAIWGGPTPPTVSLLTPGGTLVSETSLGNIEFTAGGNFKRYRIIATPSDVGAYQLQLANNTATELPVNVTVHAQDPGLAIHANASRPSYVFPEAMRLQTFVGAATGAVAGARVFAAITAPNGCTQHIRLYDDGDLEAHGDGFANDGYYTALFSDFIGDGSHRVVVTVENRRGTITAPGEGMVRVAPFRRISEFYTVATGGPVPDKCPSARRHCRHHRHHHHHRAHHGGRHHHQSHASRHHWGRHGHR
jgi:hypothetical protein